LLRPRLALAASVGAVRRDPDAVAVPLTTNELASKLTIWLGIFVALALLHAAEIAITTLYPWKVREIAEEEERASSAAAGPRGLRHDAVYEPGRPHPGQVRRAVERGLPHGRDALLRRATSQEHRRHQRREGRPAHGPAHQHHGQHCGPPRLRPLHPRQGHAQGIRHTGQGELRRVRLGAPPNRHRRPRLGDHRPLRAGDDQGRAQPTGPEGPRDDEAARRGRGGPPDHVGGVRPGRGAGERILEDTGVRGRDRQHRGHCPCQERPRLLREGVLVDGDYRRPGAFSADGGEEDDEADDAGIDEADGELGRLSFVDPPTGRSVDRYVRSLTGSQRARGVERPAGDEEEEGAHGRGRGRVRRDGGSRLAGGHRGGGAL
ncbi:hypothetical protein THAOC_33923, partial [Thalassiosira oceanica]